MQDTSCSIEALTIGRNFYPQFTMPMTIAHMVGTDVPYRVRPGDKGFILVLGGTLKNPARLSGLRPPFVACLRKGETLMTGDSGCAESSLVVVFNLEILDKEFLADSFHCPVCTEGILSRRDVEITYTFIEDTGFAKELHTDEAESLSFIWQIGRPPVPDNPSAGDADQIADGAPAATESNAADRDGMWHAYRISEFLKSHYREKVNVDDVSRAIGMNRTTLQRVFKKAYDTSVIEYLLAYRISMAAFLLRNTALSLKDISARVGFNEYSSFFREFTKRNSVSPQNFRDGSTAKVQIG